MPFRLKPATTKITHVSSARNSGIAIRDVIGKLMNGVISNVFPINMKMNNAIKYGKYLFYKDYMEVSLRTLTFIFIFTMIPCSWGAQAPVKNQGQLLQWNFKAFSELEEPLIQKVLGSRGGKNYLGLHTLSRDKELSLDEVDVVLYDIGLFSILLKYSDNKRIQFIRDFQKRSYQQLQNQYSSLGIDKLNRLYRLFN